MISKSLRRSNLMIASTIKFITQKQYQSLIHVQPIRKHVSSTSNFRSFSSAAVKTDTSNTFNIPTRKRKDPIIVTTAAAERIKELLRSPNGKSALGIRLGVKRRGCNGLSYTLNYAFQKEPNEEVMESHGVTLFIEPMALFNVVGTVMDWEETDMSSEFTFQNPNSKGQCGCGESFNV